MTMPRMIITFRHGYFELNQRSKLTGEEALQAVEAGIPLDADTTMGLLDEGKKQAHALREVLRHYKINACLYSPTRRTEETAKVALGGQRLSHFTPEPALLERNRGIFRYAPDEWARAHPDYKRGKESAWRWRPPGGESWWDIRHHVTVVLQQCRTLAPNRIIALSTHAEKMGLIRAILLEMDDKRLWQPLVPNHNDIPALKRSNWIGNGQADFFAFCDPDDPASLVTERPQYFRSVGTAKPNAFDTGWVVVG
ncbi:MAG TPA: histidine phosphatase family protein [Verrucomicrobiae bacterium]|nr:histidine phosphatase family protein [Verrucomicrobiae bacterium]